MSTHWTPETWQTKTTLQQPTYPSASRLHAVTNLLATRPPLVTPLEVNALKSQLAKVAHGEAFILQGGDCAESFADCHSEAITDKLKILLQMSLILLHGLRKPIVRIGRVAGQYAKPRSSNNETKDNITLPSYRGDLVNGPEFIEAERTPNPKRMLEGYQNAASTLNYIRALIEGGFADLHHPEYWDLDFAKHSPRAHEYQQIASNISDALNFLHTIPGGKAGQLDRVDFFTSHEALLLSYEQALTRYDKKTDAWYNLSTHFPWIGMRTADIEHGHIDYMRGIKNPIAVKIGPTMDPKHLIALANLLNPDNEPGRLTFIHRMGVKKIDELLPPLIETIKKANLTVVWSCDPMHGNTTTTQQGMKTRHFEDILSELQQSFAIHKRLGTHLGGVHFEMTGDDVTECLGGARGLTEHDLNQAYKSLVDPRLNYEQALEIALSVVKGLTNLD